MAFNASLQGRRIKDRSTGQVYLVEHAGDHYLEVALVDDDGFATNITDVIDIRTVNQYFDVLPQGQLK